MTLLFGMNATLSVLTIAGHILLVVLIVAFLVRSEPTLRFFGTHAVLFSFILALAGMLTSLYYSEIAGFEPCTLCWYQRIFLYPQVVIFGIALWRKEMNVAVESGIVLSALGALVAGYQSLLQAGVVSDAFCRVSSVSCAKVYVLSFGYLTIPLMSLTAFALILAFLLAKKYSQ